MNYKGEWRRFQTKSLEYKIYYKDDVVTHNGNTYIALGLVTGRIDPATNYENDPQFRSWELIGNDAQKITIIDGGYFA